MKVCIIGAGNVATQLALALYENSVVIDTIYNRTRSSASELAGKVEARYISDIEELPEGLDLYIISVSDEAVQGLASQVAWGDRFVVHTSGTLSIEILRPYAVNAGVFYPLQTFSKKKNVSFTNIPCFLETTNEPSLVFLKKVACKLSQSLYVADSEQRKKIHIAAVFACNFTNYFFSIADKILESGGLPFEILKPIIQETVEKSHLLSPLEAQTGPAVRKDYNVIEMHLDYLNDFPEWRDIYDLLSNKIMLLNQVENEKL